MSAVHGAGGGLAQIVIENRLPFDAVGAQR